MKAEEFVGKWVTGWAMPDREAGGAHYWTDTITMVKP
nr:MAG: hypothetical protein [Bacteriophage sp.]